MKKLTNYLLIAAIAISTIAFISNKEASSSFTIEKAEFLEFLDGNKSYTLELAEAMPADKYTYKPHDSVRSFGEQLAHMGMSTKFLTGIFIKGEAMPPQEAFAEFGKMEKEMGASKEACIEALTKALDDMKATYESMSEEQMNETFTVFFDPNQPKFSKKRGFQFIKDHMIHHRGQALVSLRMQGIKAPQYRLY
ncbi:MAG: DinB family protein [Flavobacteriaceae bacterium]|nr:DinB family protein [Flavobacteriaceae bacterium]